MKSEVFRALEFDRVREALADVALTSLGRARAIALEPARELDGVRVELELTTAAMAFVRQGGSLAISAPEDLDSIFAVLDVEDRPLDALQLLGLTRLIASVSTVASALRRRMMAPDTGSQNAGLLAIASGVADFEPAIDAVRQAIEPSGEVSDRASTALRDIRESLRRQRARLRSTLDALTRSREHSKYLQDQIITDRNGRYVVVVRAEHQDAIPGIVHGSSASGASVYLEPLTTVTLNNEIVTLSERERAEILRILTALTDGFRGRRDDLLSTFDAAARIDELYAKTELAKRVDGIAPDLTSDGRLEFKGARHPLLVPAMRELTEGHSEKHGVVVSSDLLVVPPARALVISGPNTGGKTVALKAFGLLALMAQAGLLIPVEPGSRFTPFATVFADIGDEQSIAASLSTFSAHIANIVSMERELTLPALVLLDEVGSGTDPAEGGALGAAVIEHFKRRGALVVATTHDEALKSYAATTDGVMTAGFGFNPDTYAPTYRLMYGAPGRSLAFEIAERLGMPSSLVADARSRRSTREAQLAAHLARMDEELAAIERERQAQAALRAGLETERRQVLEREARLTEREAVLKRRMDDRLNEKLREARTEVDRIVGSLKQRAQVLADQAETRAQRGAVLSTGDVGRLRSDARAALEAVGSAAEGGVPGHPASEGLDVAPEIGQTVFVRTFSAEGVVRSVSGSNVEVDVRGKRMRVKLMDLGRAPQNRDDRDKRGSTPRRPPAAAATPERLASVTRELMVIGSTVDQAIDKAEKFLDDALLADERRLRVVHGMGTGRLREALTKFFREHPLVASVSPAADNEGGAGATIVELKD
jgi:DNA mismatch repair protein MutS2